MTDQDLTLLTTAGNPVEAGALRAYLEDNGVLAHIQGEHHSSLLGQHGSFAIELNILVPVSQLEEARSLGRGTTFIASVTWPTAPEYPARHDPVETRTTPGTIARDGVPRPLLGQTDARVSMVAVSSSSDHRGSSADRRGVR